MRTRLRQSRSDWNLFHDTQGRVVSSIIVQVNSSRSRALPL